MPWPASVSKSYHNAAPGQELQSRLEAVLPSASVLCIWLCFIYKFKIHCGPPRYMVRDCFAKFVELHSTNHLCKLVAMKHEGKLSQPSSIYRWCVAYKAWHLLLISLSITQSWLWHPNRSNRHLARSFQSGLQDMARLCKTPGSARFKASISFFSCWISSRASRNDFSASSLELQQMA